MRRIDSPNQEQIWDPFDFLGSKRKALLESGWSGLFRTDLYSQLPVDAIKGAFHECMGRPTKELHTVLGTLVLQQLFDLTDQQTMHHLAFNIEWHYALNLVDEEDASKTISERTLRTYRALVVEKEIDVLLFESLTDVLLDKFKIHVEKQRLDSTHIHSDMRRLSRLGVFRRTLMKFFKVMQHDHSRLLKKMVKEELRQRYLDKENGYFAQVKPSESKAVLQQVAEDLLTVVETFRRHPKIRHLPAFHLLERVLQEQCEVQGADEAAKVVVKEPKDVPSTALQNPSDPDATYDGHKGEGYQVQIMETFTQKPRTAADGPEDETPQPDLITYVKVEPAHQSDTQAPLPAIRATKERGCAPQELLADSAYGSDDNVQKAKQEGTEIIAPTMGTPKEKEKLGLEDFWVDEETGEVTACPVGEPPSEIRTGKDGSLKIYFDATVCGQCDHQDYCGVGQHPETKMEYTPKQFRLAQRRAAEESDVFREKYRFRSGIEATMSKLKRVMKIGRLRVRGLAKVRYTVTLKVLGWNILQAARA